MKKKQAYHRAQPTWCPGCGLFGVFDALKRAAANMDLAPEDMVIVTGIGCHGRMNNYFNAYGFHGLHGRAVPVAVGVKLVNPKLQVVGVSGDGDAYSIGLGHFLHAVRKNVGITYIVVNNRLYSLTQGQMSPTTMFGTVTISTPFGSKDFPIEGPSLALAAGGTFVARGFSAETNHLAALIEKGMEHKGFALIDVLSPCVTYNKLNTYKWYKKNIFMIEKEPGYSPGNKSKAWEMLDRVDRIAIGLIYEEEKPSYEQLILPDKDKPIAFADLSVHRQELEKIMENFH
jgi:2-oxoglutarate ferredoxin oxidoreductase subunit beta